jgi:hypothetical protein
MQINLKLMPRRKLNPIQGEMPLQKTSVTLSEYVIWWRCHYWNEGTRQLFQAEANFCPFGLSLICEYVLRAFNNNEEEKWACAFWSF